MLLQAIASWNLFVWIKDTITGEAIGFVTGIADVDELTVLTGGSRGTLDAHTFTPIVDTNPTPFAVHTLIS